MAPEVLRHQEDGITPYSTPCDVWAFGILLFQLKTKLPFATQHNIKSDQLDQFIEKRIKDEVPEINLQEMIDCCLKKSPHDRHIVKDLLGHNFLVKSNNKRNKVN